MMEALSRLDDWRADSEMAHNVMVPRWCCREVELQLRGNIETPDE